MRKVYFLGVLLLACAGLLWGAGYKNFNWGLTPQELAKQLPGLQKNSSALAAVPADELYALGKQLWFGLLKFEMKQAAKEFYPQTQKYESYFSGKEGVVFYFVDGRLVCVGVDFAGKNPYQELAQKYGAKTKFHYLRVNNYTYDGALWTTPERVIFYAANALKPEFGNIYYFDPGWLASVKKRLETPETNNRVD
ncbi:hypothetical protein NO1_0524 [Candidatus Termititenax aidoneus]|uniref:Uncharacterized protein n=1 Tax=Termititenax aidoneus TaxID=2218524 RepID=A0A388TA07_TERA1|nr:hypothetical protein NO1_0524 [Candidatus Termititenax aidoneus]